jgi:hypothetical protein
MEIKVNRSQLIVFWILAILLILEMLGLVVLVYFARLPLFLIFLLDALRVLTPGVLAVNILFLIWTVFVKGQKLVLMTWQDYLRELLRFFLASFAITVVLMLISALLAALITLLLERMSVFPVVDSLRKWIGANFY